jgi:hypothetical protein
MDENADEIFVHNIAIRLSRVMNQINPNDLLARRVISMATSNDTAGFIQGKKLSGLNILIGSLYRADTSSF